MYKIAAASVLALSACSAAKSSHLYTGLLEPVSGACDPPAQAQLVVGRGTVVFTPNSGTLMIKGVQQGNALSAAQMLVGADRKPYILRFRATLQGSEVVGTYENARCRYRVSLRSNSP